MSRSILNRRCWPRPTSPPTWASRSSAARYRQQAEELKRRINDRLWLEDEGSYADFYGTRAQAISATEGVIKQIRLRGEDKMSAGTAS